jgi:hypothetical protein
MQASPFGSFPSSWEYPRHIFRIWNAGAERGTNGFGRIFKQPCAKASGLIQEGRGGIVASKKNANGSRSVSLQELHRGRRRAKEYFSGSLDDLLEDSEGASPVFHILMLHRDKILQLLNRGVEVQVIHDACVNQGLFKTSYIHFCREIRKFRLLHGYTVKGGMTPSEEQVIESLIAKYGPLYNLNVHGQMAKGGTNAGADEANTAPPRRRATLADLKAPTVDQMAGEGL